VAFGSLARHEIDQGNRVEALAQHLDPIALAYVAPWSQAGNVPLVLRLPAAMMLLQERG
jgi:hypothetical protein